MRIRTRLFLGTAGLVVGLMAAQWWLHQRQLRSVERAVGIVATTVGRGMLQSRFQLVTTGGGTNGASWVSPPPPVGGPDGDAVGTRRVGVVVVDAIRPVEGASSERRTVRRMGRAVASGDRSSEVMMWHGEVRNGSGDRVPGEGEEVRVELQVVAEGSAEDRFLVLRSGDGAEERIPIPASPEAELRQTTVRSGLAVGAGLLLVGLVSSGIMAHRLVRPLSSLAERSDALAAGALGVQVEEDASGEVGELQRAFNRMSRRLAELERQRATWRRREHLAELGDVARGLAHTLRNPLNTLGLTLEELALDRPGEDLHVATARDQIRRIDGWLRSFLAVGAGDAAERTEADLSDLVREAAMAVPQRGSPIRIADPAGALPVRVVPSALGAALSNLLENAVQASPAGAAVEVTLARAGTHSEIRIADRGPGLPEAVRRRLFEPHVTARAGGSGMGLFLARQIVESMHGGELQVTDRDDGGTAVIVRLPLAAHDGEGR